MGIESFVPGQYSALLNTQRFVDMRTQLDDLQRQMSTGKRAATYGALGAERGVSLDARARLASLEAWSTTIQRGTLRLKIMNQSAEAVSKLASAMKSDVRPGSYSLTATGQTSGQLLAGERMKQAIDALNTDLDGRYLFSGRSVDVKPVESFDVIMNGDGAGRAGVKQLISERTQADAGSGSGRLTVGSAGVAATIDEEAANPPYGFKLASATASGTGISASLTAGPPANVAFSVTGAVNAGDTVSVVLDLPDGTKQTLTLTARTAAQSGTPEESFVIGGSAAATATNIAGALSAALARETQSSLAAASAMVAARDFFNGSASNPPLRVPGPPFATATGAPAPGTAANTVIWYKGDDDTAIGARNTAPLQIGASETVNAGARANEEAYRTTLAQLAVLSAATFSASDATASRRYDAIAERARGNLAFGNGAQKPEEISIELSLAMNSLNTAKERHDTTRIYLEDVVGKVENATQEEVAAQMLQLQTRLQASYQTTSMLSKLTLTQYL